MDADIEAGAEAEHVVVAAVAAHESGHSTIARLLDIAVVRTTAGADPNTRTRYQLGPVPAETLKKLAIIDLAGIEAERRYLTDGAWHLDERNASARALQAVVIQRNWEGPVTEEIRREARQLVEELRERAGALVNAHWREIETVAAALMERDLTQGDIDSLIEQAGAEEST
jgi:hypothetical protein